MAAKKDFLTKAKASVKTESVPLPSMKMTVTARGLSVDNMDMIIEKCTLPGKTMAHDGVSAIDNSLQIIHIVAASIVDDDGSRLIPEGRERELKELPQAVYGALQTAALRVNGMSGVDAEGNS